MDNAAKVRRLTEHRSNAGKKGGKRSLETMTPEQRRERAMKALAARRSKMTPEALKAAEIRAAAREAKRKKARDQ